MTGNVSSSDRENCNDSNVGVDIYIIYIYNIYNIYNIYIIYYIYIINDSLVRSKVRLIVAYPRRPGFRSVPFPSMAAILNRWL